MAVALVATLAAVASSGVAAAQDAGAKLPNLPEGKEGTCSAYTIQGKLIAEAPAPPHADGEGHDYAGCLKQILKPAHAAACRGKAPGDHAPYLLRAGNKPPGLATAYCTAAGKE